MSRLDNFSNCLKVLKNADFKFAYDNEIYQMGVVCQFERTFELAWKALQEVLKIHGAEGAATGFPIEVLQLGFVDDPAVWLLMLKKRNTSVHIYDEDEVDEMILLIRDSFIPAFIVLEKTLQSKLDEAESEWDKNSRGRIVKRSSAFIILIFKLKVYKKSSKSSHIGVLRRFFVYTLIKN